MSTQRRRARGRHPLAALCVAGGVSVHIDRTLRLDEVPAAHAHVAEGRALGTVVVG